MIAVLRLLYRLAHPGQARRVYALDHAHRDRDGQRVPLAEFPSWSSDPNWNNPGIRSGI